jgi:SAM-dependent methyltransferase
MSTTISHETSSFLPDDRRVDDAVQRISKRLANGDTVLPLAEERALLAALTEFDLGRFLLLNGGLSGYWTSYVFTHEGSTAGTELERWLLKHSTLAGIRQRYERLSELVAPRLGPGRRVASVPCGVMDDVLRQPTALLDDVSVIGADIDDESLRLAAELAEQRGVSDRVELRRADAWDLDLGEPVDLLLSNGLNIYESDRERLVALYRQFHDNLVPGGELLVSYIPPLPPPPASSPVAARVWASLGMSADDVRRDRAIFGDLLSAKYLNVTSTDELTAQLREAGLSLREVHFSEYGVLPIAVATRPLADEAAERR